MAIEGSDVSVSKGPTGTGIFPNPASKPFDKLPQSGIGIDRGVELEQTLLAIVKDATRGGSKEKGHGVVPTHGTPELSRGVWGHRKAIRGGGRPHRIGQFRPRERNTRVRRRGVGANDGWDGHT